MSQELRVYVNNIPTNAMEFALFLNGDPNRKFLKRLTKGDEIDKAFNLEKSLRCFVKLLTLL